jgi:hypothetical protein
VRPRGLKTSYWTSPCGRRKPNRENFQGDSHTSAAPILSFDIMEPPGAHLMAPPPRQRVNFPSTCPTGSCTDNTNHGDDGWGEISPLRDLSVLQESSRRGCPVCRFLLQVVDSLYPGWTSSDIAAKQITQRRVIALRHHGRIVIRFWLSDRIPGTDYLFLHYTNCASAGRC